MKKHSILTKKLLGESVFVASTGWLKNFKPRHREKLNANVLATELFSDNVKKYIKENKFDIDFIYSVHSTVYYIYWKALPSKSLVSQYEIAAPGI